MEKLGSFKDKTLLTQRQQSIKRRMEQIEQLKHEKDELMRKKEEIKRLEGISESPPPKRAQRTRSRSAEQKRRPIEKPVIKEQQDANHHEWTESYARKSR